MMMNLFVCVFQHRTMLFNFFYLSIVLLDNLHFILVLELIMGFQDEAFLPTQPCIHTTFTKIVLEVKDCHISYVCGWG